MKKDMSNREVNALLSYLGDLYCRYSVESGNNEYKKAYVKCIDQHLTLLSRSQELLLRKTYFEKEDQKWWRGFYSKTTYYRERERASRIFLHCVM